MLKRGTCPQCQSADVIPDVAIIDRGHYNTLNLPLTVGIFRNPASWLKKKLFQSQVKAWICGSCGYTELFVQDPAELLQIHRSSHE